MAVRKVEFEDGIKPEDAAKDYPNEYVHEVQRHIKRDEAGESVYVNILVLGDAPKEKVDLPKTLEQRIEELEAQAIESKNEDARIDNRIKNLEGA